MATRPKSTAMRQRTRPARACEMAAIALVTPTTSRDIAMACLGSMPAT